MLKNMTLALLVFKTELRKSVWWIIFFSIFIAITGITTAHFYIDRLERGLAQESIRFLGGELVITRASAIPAIWHEKAKQLKLQSAEVWSYPSMIRFQNKMQLVNVQAVSLTYPLIGNRQQKISAGKVWIDPRLHLNQTLVSSKLKLGALFFEVERVLTPDINQLNTGWPIAPKIMVNNADIPATQTLVPGSRVEYRLLLTGQLKNISQFRSWVSSQLMPGDKLIDKKTQRLPLQNIIDKTLSYIQITLFMCLILGAIAIVLSLKYYLNKQYDQIALWQCLGASKSQIVKIFLYQLFFIALIAGGLGVTSGLGLQQIFENLFRDFFPFELPPPHLSTLLMGFSLSFTLLFMFALPQLLELPQISPLQIWRKDFKLNYAHGTLYLAIFSYFFLIFTLAYLKLTPAVIGTLFILLGVGFFLYILSTVLLKILKFIQHQSQGPIRQGLKQLTSNANYFHLKFICLNLIIIGLALLSFTKNHLMTSFIESLPNKTPNYFLINLLKEEIGPLKKYLLINNITVEAVYPMVRGRLIGLNQKNIFTVMSKKNQSHNALHRELNLSWMWQFPADNKELAGERWHKNLKGQPVISIEHNLAEDLNLKLGDTLTFQIGEKKLEAKIIQLRSLDWTSFHPNFFIIFPPGVLEDFPTTYITSLYLNTHQVLILEEIVRQFPNITIIDVSYILNQIQQILAKILIAINYLFYFALALGILILIAILQTILPEHRKIYRLMFTLGAKRSFITHCIMIEISTAILAVISTAWILSFFTAKILKWYYFS